MLKALAIVLIILLASLSATAYSPSSVWSITVLTDKPYYYTGDKVYISGRLTYGGYATQSIDVAIVVKLSGSTGLPYHLNTTTTDSNGIYNDSFPLAGPNAILGEYVVNVTAGVADTRCTNQMSFQLINAIYIRADGDVDPVAAPVSRNGEVYSLTGDISSRSADGIVIERNNIILDGAGFTVNGTYPPNLNGIKLTSVYNVTVSNIAVRFFSRGICENFCHNCHIVETNLSSDGYGIYFQQSHFNSIGGNIITKNSYAGIYLESSDNNNISDNELTFNTILSNGVGGIRLSDFSNGNIIVDNTLVNNTHYGIYIENSWQNSIFHDNFVNHTIQAFVDSYSQNNVWDDGYLSGGNYWSDYAGADAKSGPNQNLPGSDNIGDTAYTIDSNNKDNYPLMNVWNPITFDVSIAGNPVPIMMTTNTTITNTGSTPNTLVFTASGPTGTTGYVLVIVPVGLNSTDILVTIDGAPPSAPYPIITTDGTDYFVYFRFGLSSHQILLVIGAPMLPLPAVPLGPLAATVAMILVLAAYFTITKRKIERAEMPNPGPSVDSCALRTTSMDGGASSSEQH